jgi:competence protein ComEA
VDAPAPTTANVPAPPAPRPELERAWPRSAQLAFAFLLGSLLSLLAVHAYSQMRWGAKPSDLERGVGVIYRIDLNRATRAELLQLPGIGESLARRIDDYRTEHAGFRQVNDLIEVHGIGPATLERLRPWVQVNSFDGELPAREEITLQTPVSRPKNRDGTAESKGAARKPNSKEAALTELIDINRATLTELQRLPGVGPKMSQKIVDERANAPFKSVDELRRVHGIGVKTLERLRPHVTVKADSPRLVASDRESDSAHSP